MSDDPNFWDCIGRLDGSEDPPVSALVEAAFSTEEGAIDRALAAGTFAHAGSRPASALPPPMYLRSVKVKGFRGIGPEAVLELPVGPGLTIVTGRNGCGKSSFAEALELALTGENSRWSESARADELQGGWRNLHDGRGVRIDVDLCGEVGPSTLSLRWPDGATQPDAHTFSASLSGATVRSRRDLRWSQAVSTYKPILTYAGLGDLTAKKNAELYDQLQVMLGLDSLRAAVERLAGTRRQLESARKEADRGRAGFLSDLEPLADERATNVVAAVRRRPWDLDAVEALCDGDADESPEGVLLHDLERLVAPDAVALTSAAHALREHHEQWVATRGSQSGRSEALAQLLEQALAWHAGEPTPCPVCREGTLGPGWADTTRSQLAAVQQEATTARDAQGALATAMRRARDLLSAPPGCVLQARALLPDDPTHDLWLRFAAGRAIVDAREMADHLDAFAATLPAAAARLQSEARSLRAARNDEWRPVARRILAWLPVARSAVDAQAKVKVLKEAEALLVELGKQITIERFRPIEARTKQIWESLRQRSHVELQTVALEGGYRNTKRRVELSVRVDGQENVALGVMSQGELHSLALSLFLPRLTHDQSPFHFVVLDDPVQAMDPYKVDGLARVLEDAARTRQVVVFTHDSRLPEAIRRMGIEATVLSVERGAGSTVRVVPERDPVRAYLDEAYALSMAADRVGPKATARVVPGFCRGALEAFFRAAYRRRALTAGTSHAEVDARLAAARDTNQLAALGLFSDLDAGADVLPWIKKKAGAEGVEAYKACKAGAHQGWDHHHRARVRQTERLLVAMRNALR
ncbi:MAG: AAA family ATPase [Myxococcota bacterium]